TATRITCCRPLLSRHPPLLPPRLRIPSLFSLSFSVNDTAPTALSTLSLHDALPILTDFSRPGYVTTIRVKFQNTKVYEIHLLNIGNSFNKPIYEIDSYIY